MAKMEDNKMMENRIVCEADVVLKMYETEGANSAIARWREFDESVVAGNRNRLSAPVLDLVLELEFFLEGNHEVEFSDLLHSLYVARVSLH